MTTGEGRSRSSDKEDAASVVSQRDPMCDYTVDPTYLMERHGRTCECVWTEEQVADIKRRAKEIGVSGTIKTGVAREVVDRLSVSTQDVKLVLGNVRPESHEAAQAYQRLAEAVAHGEGRFAPWETQPTTRTVTICGSMRFFPAMLVEAGRLTALGHVVHLPVPSDGLPSTLVEVHHRKIDASDAVLVVNLRGYVGESTQREIAYAEQRGVPITYTQEAGR